MTENDEDSDTRLVQRQTTGEDRVRMVARQLAAPQTANWIASEAQWSHEPTKRVLERLVDDGVLRRDDSGPHTTDYPDYRQQAMREAIRLRDGDQSVEELTNRLAEMNAQIRDWEDEFAVESPNHLRATLVDGTSALRKRIVDETSHVTGNTSSSASRSSALQSASGSS